MAGGMGTRPTGWARGPLPPLARVLLAEIAGTFGLVFLGAGGMTVDAAGDGDLGGVGIGLTFGLAVTAMVLAFGRTSGAHINPAVTVGLWLAGHFRGALVGPYVVAQLVGALIAASVWHGLYHASPGALGATLPQGDVWQSFGLEIVLMFVLMYVILAVGHEHKAPLAVVAAAAGMVVGLETVLAGGISGASMNPARSFGPAAIAWEWRDQWVYWTAPIIGVAIAMGLHRALRPSGGGTPGG